MLRARALLYGLEGAEASACSSLGAKVMHWREHRLAIHEPRSPPRRTETKGTGSTIDDTAVRSTYPNARPRDGDSDADPAVTSADRVSVEPNDRPRLAIMMASTAAYSTRIVAMMAAERCDRVEATKATRAAPSRSMSSVATRLPGDAGTGTRVGDEDVIAPSAKLNRRDRSRMSRPVGVGSRRLPERCR